MYKKEVLKILVIIDYLKKTRRHSNYKTTYFILPFSYQHLASNYGNYMNSLICYLCSSLNDK